MDLTFKDEEEEQECEALYATFSFQFYKFEPNLLTHT